METVSFKDSSAYRTSAEEILKSEKNRILDLFPSVDVQHIGGTAIPGLLTKGDVDINVRVHSNDFDAVMRKMKELYEINQPNNWTTTFASFKDDNLFELPFGVQVTVIGSPDDHFVGHRDALLSSPELVHDLNELKKQFEGSRMDAYRNAKAKFLNKLPDNF